MALDQTRANQILDAVHAVTALPVSTAPIRTRLMTVNGSATTNGTELTTGGGYTSGTGAPSATWGAAGTGTSAKGAVSVTNMPAATIVGIEEWDSNATPKRQEFGPLSTAKTVAAGDTLSFAAGAITSALG